jgi:hypothetical protein
MPEPCEGPQDVVCRKHLQGTGVFEIDASSSDLSPLVSQSRDEAFIGGPGRISIVTGFLGEPIPIDLYAARVWFSEEAETLSGIIGGGVTRDQLHERLIPAYLRLIAEDVDRDCPDAVPATCVCNADTTGKTELGLFDANHDCAVSIDELENNSLTVSLLSPDLGAGNSGPLLSFGFGFEAVTATIVP